ncbi:MFS transporter [Saccharothrix syringae]|uniref:MFS transporter n=1 Tax=Saccharothrix syringae TaxID=103733 RepID=A0A5Q0H6W0_SACSY|nr:MFS transporter [Saccharothrix syringae]QFZ21452.1 MFS transporter [Saccharothrix syringae]
MSGRRPTEPTEADPRPGAAPVAATPPRHPLPARFTVLLGYLVVPMALSGTTIALPHVATTLGGSGEALQWVLTGYFLAASCLMLVAGSLGDLFGRRRVYRIGAATYVAGTVACALAQDVLVLDVARTVCGIGAAGIMAGGGAILAQTFEGEARTRAFALVGTSVGVGLAFGPTLSGWLVDAFGWRAMFGAFAAAALVVLLGTLLSGESAAATRPRLDLPGAATLVVALAALMWGLNQVTGLGWTSPVVLGCLALSAVAFAAFAAVERRREFPIVPLSLLGDRRFAGWLVAALTTAVGTAGVLVYLPTYLQSAGGVSPGDTGAVMLAMTLPILVTPPLAGRLVTGGASPRLLIAGVMALFAAGNAWLTTLDASGVPPVLGPLVLIGIANGVAAGIVDAQAMDLVPAERVGMASGLLHTMRGGANTLVVTLFGAALVSVVQAGVGDRALAGRVVAGDPAGPDRAALVAEYTSAWQVVLWCVAALCALAGLAVHRMLRPHDRP